MIEVKNITKTYGKKQNAFLALDDVSFTIPTGASVAILGKSGSGKSTLMHAMSGLDRPEKGEVIVDGVDILKLKSKDVDIFRSKKIGFIFQSFFVQANETVFDNVSLPLEIANAPASQRRAKVDSALEKVELTEKVRNKARNLSGGQKQRLAIARAIVNEPSIIFADEPTGNLDPKNTWEIVRLLEKINKYGTTVLLTTHNAEIVNKLKRRVITIEDGKITADQAEGSYRQTAEKK